MTLHQIVDAALIVSLLSTLFALRLAVKRGDLWHDRFKRDWLDNATDQIELLHWKQNAVLRDPKTGRYVKKDKRNG
jgi:hypothetical protein